MNRSLDKIVISIQEKKLKVDSALKYKAKLP